MNNKITLYHGSPKIIEKPIYGVGNFKNDYGLGFYCTEAEELSKEWSVSDGVDGYSNKYELDISDLKILNLSSKEYNVLHWITILLENRVFDLKYDISKAGKEYLLKNFSIPYNDYDIIIGYRADDSYFSFAESFLANTISVQRLSQALKLGDLGEQVVLKSKKAFSKINFISSSQALSDIYYPLRKIRNEKVRLAFLNDKGGPFNPNAIYLHDIIKGGIKNDDPRLR